MFELDTLRRGHIENLSQPHEIASQPQLLLRVLLTYNLAVIENVVEILVLGDAPHVLVCVDYLFDLLLFPKLVII